MKSFYKHILLISIMITAVFASNIEMKKGWGLYGTNVYISNLNSFSDIDLMWKYDQYGWKVASPSQKYYHKLHNQTLYEPLLFLKEGDGFWAYLQNSDENITIAETNITTPFIDIKQGWNLSSIISNRVIYLDDFMKDKNITIIWSYHDNKWEGYSPINSVQSLLNDNNISKLEYLYPFEGFWILSGNEQSINLIVPIYTSILQTGDKMCLSHNDSTTSCDSQDLLQSDVFYHKGLKRRFARDDSKEIVSDLTTGLMWQDNEEAKSVQKGIITEQNYDKCHNQHNDLACYDTSGDTASNYCETLTFGGYSDWRLPNIRELQTLVYVNSSKFILPVFKNLAEGNYWSKTPLSSEKEFNWFINYIHGGYVTSYSDPKGSSFYIRCVRGEKKYIEREHFIRDSKRQVVYDIANHLVWQDSVDNRDLLKSNITDAIEYCENLNFNDEDDWRLPNINELFSMVDLRHKDPAVSSAFNYIKSGFYKEYWSSTNVYKTIPGYFYTVSFYIGSINKALNSKYSHYIRCVRDANLAFSKTFLYNLILKSSYEDNGTITTKKIIFYKNGSVDVVTIGSKTIYKVSYNEYDITKDGKLLFNKSPIKDRYTILDKKADTLVLLHETDQDRDGVYETKDMSDWSINFNN